MAPRASRTSKKATRDESLDNCIARFVSTDRDSNQLFILPKHISPNSKIISLPRAATGKFCRYLFCPETGLYEYTKIAAPPQETRSWLISTARQYDAEQQEDAKDSSSRQNAHGFGNGYVQDNANLYVATPFDPLFLSSPLFSGEKSEKAMFRLLDDHLDVLCKHQRPIESMLRDHTFISTFEKRLRSICQVQDLGEEKAYKPDKNLLLKEIMRKAQRLVANAWSPSMDEKFVNRALELPLTVSQLNDAESTEKEEQETDGHQSRQSLIAERASSNAVSAEIILLQRVAIAIRYILFSYLEPSLRDSLLDLLSTQEYINFAPLNEHLAQVQQVKEKLQALRSISENIARKRNIQESDEQAEIRAEKKRKKEEEDKKLKAEPRAIKQLKKADTTGMKKLSNFFTKATP